MTRCDVMRQKFMIWVKAHPRVKTLAGWVLVVVGFIGLVTPFTPWGVLFFVGLELLGLRLAFAARIEKFKQKFKSRKVSDDTNDKPPTTDRAV